MLRKVFVCAAVLLALPFFVVAADRSSVCTLAKKPGLASCHAHVILDGFGRPKVGSSPVGFGPAELRSAYRLPGRAAGRTIVAIVDAYDDPTVEGDLDVYSRQFGLPALPICAGGIAASPRPCFQKINQRGTASVPAVNRGWSIEIALDVEVVHALCENCSILLVEASSPNMKNLLRAEDAAVAAGAGVVSNSWGGPEFWGERRFDAHFEQAGVAFVASSGDSGYGVQYPAASPFVAAVGGTSLYMNGGKYTNEDAWSGTGSGCSRYEPKPAWQDDLKCAGRTVADVSAVADPNTGFAVYTTTATGGRKGWFKVGGTSLAAPIIAATYAQGGVPTDNPANSLPYLRGNARNLHDVVGGSNGVCAVPYLCTGKTHYDGPTGLGSPKGLGAF